jgi:hypothetical protein
MGEGAECKCKHPQTTDETKDFKTWSTVHDKERYCTSVTEPVPRKVQQR